MHKYLSILRIGWLDVLAYRTEFFVSVFGWGIRIFIALFLWLAVTESRGGAIGPYDFEGMMVYLFLVQIISSFIFSRVGFDIAQDIYRGNFANFLLKPIHYLVLRLIHEVSKNVFRTVIGVVLFGGLLVAVTGGIALTLPQLLMGALSMVGAYLINFCLVAMLALSAFWLTSSTRFMFVYFGILTIFSGMMFPLDLFPPQIFRILLWFPFAYIFYFPAKIFQTALPASSLIEGFTLQGLSAALLIILLGLMYRRGVRKFEAVGR